MEEILCKKCQTPVPPYLYAVNHYTLAIIWVNEHAKNVPCANCGADVREGNTKVDSKKNKAG
jgi:RNase P subunit RPR2